jgi:hypothetical protein
MYITWFIAKFQSYKVFHPTSFSDATRLHIHLFDAEAGVFFPFQKKICQADMASALCLKLIFDGFNELQGLGSQMDDL